MIFKACLTANIKGISFLYFMFCRNMPNLQFERRKIIFSFVGVAGGNPRVKAGEKKYFHFSLPKFLEFGHV